MRRHVSEGFGMMVVPAICCAVTLYFGYNGIFGERGILALNNSQAELGVAKRDLADITARRQALQHRIGLLNDNAIDPDLLEEVARGVLLEGRAGDVAIPREKR
jgi:cell division protein FtsB